MQSCGHLDSLWKNSALSHWKVAYPDRLWGRALLASFLPQISQEEEKKLRLDLNEMKRFFIIVEQILFIILQLVE